MNTILALLVFFAAVGAVTSALAPEGERALAVVVVLFVAGASALVAASGVEYMRYSAAIDDLLISSSPAPNEARR